MFYIVLVVCSIGFAGVNSCLNIPEKEIKIQVGDSRVIEASLHDADRNSPRRTIDLIPEHVNIISAKSSSTKSDSLEITITALSAGKSELIFKCGPNLKNETEDFFILVEVHHSKVLDIVSTVFGWLYFLCWSACFYPQLYDNYKTKSVVGLNFDTVLFGLVGYIMYNTFNVAMVYIPLIRMQYSQRYPTGITPVLTNDLVFSMHGVAVTSLTAFQCLIYDREKQRVSITAAAIVALSFIVVASGFVLAACDVIIWLDVAYLCSYVKMYGNITLYLPQVYMNYRRRSTSGFSITGVIIDLFGGVFSIVQIFMDGYNYDDWRTVFENPTKFGIGVITMGVSVVFLIQHYVLYNSRDKKKNLDFKIQA